MRLFRRDRLGAVPDVRHRTERERRDEAIERRRKVYLMIMGPWLVLVILGFFVLPWTGARIAVLLVALFVPPIAAVVANTGRR